MITSTHRSGLGFRLVCRVLLVVLLVEMLPPVRLRLPLGSPTVSGPVSAAARETAEGADRRRAEAPVFASDRIAASRRVPDVIDTTPQANALRMSAAKGASPRGSAKSLTRVASTGTVSTDLSSAPRRVTTPGATTSLGDADASLSVAASSAADPADPFIAAQAQALNHDANQIFAFVRDQIGYEAYSGSLRGARGTLWSKAGNALDRASLLIALLRASGFTARYVQGTLGPGPAGTLILSMFQGRFRVLGCLPAGSVRADPANDPTLLAIVQAHAWVEFSGSAGGPFTAADPSFPSAQPGQVFGVPSTTFAEVPANLQHTVTFTIDAETFSQASAAFGVGNGIGTTTVLSQTLATAELVGRPVTVGQFVNAQTLGSVLSATTSTYSPYLLVARDPSNPDADEVIRGTDFQEAFTNFPLGSTILTGLFVRVTVTDAAGVARVFDKTLFDRIGFAGRNGSSVQVAVNPGTAPSLSSNDMTTFNVLPALQDESIIGTWGSVNDAALAELKAIAPRLTDSPTPSADQVALRQRAEHLSLGLMINTQRVLTANFARASDILADRFATNWYVKAFLDSPRLIAASSRVADAGSGTTGIRVGFDLLKDDIQVLLAPGQTGTAASAYRANRGLLESHLEGLLLKSFAAAQAPVSGISVNVPVSATDILQEAANQGVATTVFTSVNLGQLDALTISADAKVRVARAVEADRIVLIPNHAVSIDGVPRLGWLEVSQDGTMTGVLEDGSHGGIIEFAAVRVLQAALVVSETATILWFTGFFAGWTAGQLVALVGFSISGFKVSPTGQQFLSIAATNFIDVILKAIVVAVAAEFPTFIAGFFVGLQASQFGYLAAGVIDPPLPEALFGVNPSTEFATLGSGASGGVAIDAVPDALFTLPVNGAQLPTVFRVGIKNLSGAADTFALDVSSVPAGFTAQTSLPQVAIPAGETAELSVCLRPVGDLPAPGAPASFAVRATSVTNAAVTATATEAFTVPEIHGVALTSDPPAVSTTPGSPVSATFTLTAAGNAPETVDLTATLPSGLSADALGSVSLGVGETATRILTVTPSSGTPLNTTLTAVITAKFGPAATPVTQTIRIPVAVVVPGAAAIADAATAAGRLGDPALASRLHDLSAALTDLTQDPTDAVDKGQVLASLDAVIELLASNPDTSAVAAELAARRAALSQATTPGKVLAALDDIGGALATVDAILSGRVRHDFAARLEPNSQVASLQVPVSFILSVQNAGTETTTYQLSVEGLPGSVTGQVSAPSVTLGPGEASSNLNVTLTQTSTTALVPVGFNVRITPTLAPALSRTVSGSLTARSEIVSVVNVTATPPFAPAGTSRTLAARLLNAVNQVRQASIEFAVKGPTGSVVHQGASAPVELGVVASLVTVDLGTLTTMGFAPGTYTVEVTVKDGGGAAVPGATGTGTLLVGTPVTASIAVDPEIVAAGTRTVNTTLQIDSQVPLSTQFSQIAQLPGPAHTVALKGTVGYFCGPNGIQIVDVSDPENPVVEGSFGAGQIVNSGFTYCKVSGDHLIVRTQVNGNITLQVRVYSIANPTAPQLLSGTPATADYFFGADLVVAGSTVLVPTLGFCFFLGNHDVFEHWGDLAAFDISNPASPAFASALFDGPIRNLSGCRARGGPHNMFQAVLADPSTLLVTTTTVQGTDTNAGVGRIRVIDIANPAQLSIVEAGELQIPGTVHLISLAKDDALGVALGSTGGWNDFQQDLGLTGNVVVATLDLTNPRQPVLIATRVLDRRSRNLNRMEVIGKGLFIASSLGGVGDPPQVLLIDARDPQNPIVSQVDLPVDTLLTAVEGDIVYGTNAAGFSIYRLGGIGTIPVTAQVQIPKNTGVTIVPNSFSDEPDEIVAGAQFDTLVWRRGLAAGTTSLTFNWQEQVAEVQPGEAREVTLDTAVEFVSEGTEGRIPLAALAVLAEQVLALDPPTRTVRPGEVATYTITVKNPGTFAITYTLTAQGVPAEWVGLQNAVTAPPGSTQQIPLTLRAEALAALGEYGFAVTAQGLGFQASVLGTLVLAGDPVLPDGTVRSVVVSLTPAQTTAGQGTAALFALRVTNVGSVADTYAITVVAPPGFTTTPMSAEVPVGIGNFREVQLAVVPPPGTPVGNAGISVRATSTADATVFAEAAGTVSVAAVGVTVALSPPAGAPGSTFQMAVRNTGAAMETFDLSLGGPAGVAATLGAPSVTLAPGASQVVSVNVGPINFATPGAVDLTGVATARSNAAVKGSATARVAIVETAGIAARFDPALAILPAPGGAVFLLQVQSTGNREDSYQASIVVTSGPIAARLSDLDGLPVQSVPLFRIPGLSAAALFLDATLQSSGQGTVTVRVQSLTDQSVAAEATATLRSQGTNVSPVAHAGADQQVLLGTSVALDGSASQDPDSAPQPLTFAWAFVSTPPGSGLDDTQIAGVATAHPTFEPDVRGDYVLRLTVSDGAASATDEVLVQALNRAPVAIAGRDHNVARGSTATLDGTESFDPDGDPITYEWSFLSVPAGSGLTSASIAERTGPAPSFIPDVPGSYALRLVVRDQETASDPSLVTVRAWAANVPPNAHAGPDRHVALNGRVALDGRASHDPDGGPRPLTFAWTVAAVPPGSQLTSSRLSERNQAQASFVPDVAGDYRMSLRVGDGETFSDDEVIISAQAENVAPNADAGPNIAAVVGVALTLNGSASADPDTGPAPLTYHWRFVSVPAGSGLSNAQIADADAAQPRFTPDVVGPYVLELTVSDGAAGDFDNVLVVAGEAGGPTCFGRLATIFVRDGAIVGGPDNGMLYRGLLRGTPGDDVIVGTPGNDRIAGNGGNDVVCGGEGDDTIETGPGHDMVDGGPGNDLIKTFGGNDYVLGGEGNDFIEGGDGDDIIDGGSGDDLIKGQAGRDVLRGGDGNDTMEGGAADDSLLGGRGRDVLKGQEGADLLDGGDGDDTIEGGPAGDFLLGGPGRDLLKGQEGNDVLDGGLDPDHLDGGPGADECRDELVNVKDCER